MVSQLLGLTISIKGKRKTAWSATYWEDGKEVDVTGWEMKLPNGEVVPQLTGNDEYKYLGTELTTGWKEGQVHSTLRRKAVRKCRQIIGLIGHVPCLRQDQMAKGMSLGIAGILGYYGRATVIRWEDCVEIEKARAAAMRARGFTPGVPRTQMYKSHKYGGMGHEHAYTYAAAELCDQIDRALCVARGEPARLAVRGCNDKCVLQAGRWCAGAPARVVADTPRE